MADFPLLFQTRDYRTEHGQLVQAVRGHMLCELSGLPFICDAFLDTAAPFCVVPYGLSRRISWQRLATTLTPMSGPGSPSALSWQGIPSELGTITLRCIHRATGLRSRPLQTLAKYVLQPLSPTLDRILILGLNLLADNDVELVMKRTGGMLSGYLSIP